MSENELSAASSRPASVSLNKKKEEEATRVDHSQYPSNPLATAASNEMGPTCAGLAHRWPADYSYGDTCMCGSFYLDTRKDGVIVVTEAVHEPTCDD